ncbi:hypothetical protein GCM10027294_27960 [Marinactinospora endophytica]
MLGEHLGIQVEDLRLAGITMLLVAVMTMAGLVASFAGAGGVLVCSGHSDTVSLSCACGMTICGMRNKVA